MYASLDEIDVRARTATGEELFVQTDERTANEILAAPELSLVFAAIRTLNPPRAGQVGRFVVRYESAHAPPDFLRRVIASASARHTVAGVELPYDGELLALDDAVDEALAKLAADLAPAGITAEALAALETSLAKDPPAPTDHAAYWRAVVGLGAVAGERMRAAPGGRWTRGKQSTLPFVFETTLDGARARINPFGSAIKLLAGGAESALSALVARVRGGA